MLLSWLKNYRRRRLLATPFPAGWHAYVERNVALAESLSPSERARLRDNLRIFIAEKNWEGCGGLAITEEIQVTVAAHACLLLLGLEHDYFRRVLSVLVYPSAYRDPGEHRHDFGVVDEGSEGREGEAWYRGPVVLSWDSVLADGRDPSQGRNLVLHEFAHQLDFLDGASDGTPPLGSRQQYRRWHEVMSLEYDRLVRASERGRATLLDHYGATNPSEFFAVATECFFTRPVATVHRHPQLYQVLREYYGQDPAKRSTGP
jgi:Mlc titration factor MtfA (ptsG expression regulator)